MKLGARKEILNVLNITKVILGPNFAPNISTFFDPLLIFWDGGSIHIAVRPLNNILLNS
jgi:hypothetical protein